MNINQLPNLLSLPQGDWMKPVNPDPFILGLTGDSPASSIKEVKSEFLDTHLLDLPLRYFFEPGYIEGILKPWQNQALVILERMSQLNNAMQLTKRFKTVEVSDELKVRDVLVSWQDSPLKYVLMMDDELLGLKASDVPKISSFKLTAERIQDLAKTQQISVDQDTLTSSNVQDMRIVDMALLNRKTFHRLGQHVPPVAFSVISLGVIPGLEVGALTRKQQSVLCSESVRMHMLDENQVKACVSKMKLKFLCNLSDEQILDLDFSLINKEMFHTIFERFSMRMVLLQDCSLDRIYEICGYFKRHHWQCLTHAQVLGLDFGRIHLDSEIFDALFSSDKRLLSKISGNQLRILKPFLTNKHMAFLSDHQKTILGTY